MATGQIWLIEDELYDYETDTKTIEKRLHISDRVLSLGEVVEVLTPKGWIKMTISKDPEDNWRFSEYSLKPVGIIARTL